MVRLTASNTRKAALILVLGAAVTGYADVRAQSDGIIESPDGPEAVKVYYTLDEALDKVFDQPDSSWTERWLPDDEQRRKLSDSLGWAVPADTLEFHRARKKDRDLGFAMVTEEQGRFKPITFMVHVQPDGEVGLVLVMVYRESRGDGVKRQRFLKQFKNKGTSDHLRLNRDIVGVSGATMSSRAIAAGVKRVLALVDYRYLRTGGGP